MYRPDRQNDGTLWESLFEWDRGVLTGIPGLPAGPTGPGGPCAPTSPGNPWQNKPTNSPRVDFAMNY